MSFEPSFRKALAFGFLTYCSLSTLSAASTTTDLDVTIPPGGYVDLAVPDGKARSVTVEFSNVVDPSGRIAIYRMEAIRGGRVVESRRVGLRVPGRTVTQPFNRAFDKIRIRDGEGALSADVGMVTFCPVSNAAPGACTSAHGSDATKGSGNTTDRGRGGGNSGSSGTGDQTGGRTVWPGSGGTDKPVTPGTGGATGTPVRDDRDTPTPGGDTGSSVGGGATAPGGGGGTGSVGDSDPASPVGDDTGSGDQGTPTTGGDDGSQTGGGVKDGDYPVHGEATPISRYSRVIVQAGTSSSARYDEASFWGDLVKTSAPARYIKRWQSRVLDDIRDIPLGENGLPSDPGSFYDPGKSYMHFGLWWPDTQRKGLEARDAAGQWLARMPEGFSFAFTPLKVTDNGDGTQTFTCEKGKACNFVIAQDQWVPQSSAPEIVQLTDHNGRPLVDKDNKKNGLITRQLWREAMVGYDQLRMMSQSAATNPDSAIIRYDEFAPMGYHTWGGGGPAITNKRNVGRRDVQKGTGRAKWWAPVEARLRASWEIGAVYHHNFPHLFTENRDDFDPAVIGEWFETFMADPTIDMDKKLGILNDYEMQHVDQFGAEMMANRQYIVNNQILVEVSNETWNYAWPFNRQLGYMKRKGEARAAAMGQHLAGNQHPQMVEQGYLITKSIARLRKMYPAIEWRGVFPVHTESVSAYKPPKGWKPDTASGFYNMSLHGLITGYQMFWQEYNANPEKFRDEFADEPARPGDWFEVQGTTYFDLAARSSSGKSTLGGIAPSDFLERAGDEAQWPGLRKELMKRYLDSADPTKYGIERTRGVFKALADHAEYYGMQVGSYEGGNHTNVGKHWTGKRQQYPQIDAFHLNMHRSVEMAIIQAAVHDAAVDAGWMGLSDFGTIQRHPAQHIFGARRFFDDVTPIWCEYVRWMKQDLAQPVGLPADNSEPGPFQKCGAVIDYLNAAKDNGYYLQNPVPESDALIP